MSTDDALAITARQMIRTAEREVELAVRRARLAEAQLESAEKQVADMLAEYKPSSPDDGRRVFAERVVDYMWRTIMDAKHDDDGPYEMKGRVTDWLEYRLEQWSKP